MMMLNLFSNVPEESFYPLTFTKPVSALRMGAFTFAERWEKLLKTPINHYVNNYLKNYFFKPLKNTQIFIDVNYFPNYNLVDAISSLKNGEALFYKDNVIAFNGLEEEFLKSEFIKTIDFEEELIPITKPHHLYVFNKHAIEFDFQLLTKDRKSENLSNTNQLIGNKDKLFIEEGAEIECATFNTKNGAIYIGKNAEVMEGSHLRGPVMVCEGAKVKLGSRVYGETTIGPYSKIAGELNKTVISGYSNKAHDGYLGCSVIGEWCNLGADTNSSNMKNNYGEVKLYNYVTGEYEKTGEIFCGVIMADHVKTAINTQINTGTVIEPFANIFQTNFPPRRVKAFSWGGSGDERYAIEKAVKVAEIAMKRRNKSIHQKEIELYHFLFNML